jgi:putative endonuclease
VSSSPGRPDSTRQKGLRAEALARVYLEQAGLQTLHVNYRCKAGEIDLIMRDRQTLVMVEVRYRADARSIDPAVTVTAAKQRRILNTARRFLQSNPEFSDAALRFDVVAVYENLERPQIRWIRDGFDASGIMHF